MLFHVCVPFSWVEPSRPGSCPPNQGGRFCSTRMLAPCIR
jgi:hypothetical protein